MTRLATLVFASSAALTLSACESQAHSVSYFQSHQAEREAALSECKAGAALGQSCENAAKAQALATNADTEARFRARLGGS